MARLRDFLGKSFFLTGTLAISLISGLIVLIFSIWWFNLVSGNCGVVRFYEQLGGALIIFFWLMSNGLGLGLVKVGYKKKSITYVFGLIIPNLANCLVIAVCVLVFVNTQKRLEYRERIVYDKVCHQTEL